MTCKRRKLLGIVLILFAVICVSYLPVCEFIDSYRRNSIANELEETVKDRPESELDRLIRNAKAYNASLSDEPVHLNKGEDILDYESQLQAGEKGTAFATLYIPKIDLQMPIYHGTTKQVLQAGVGHVEGTAMPVGGNSTHTILAGHSGMTGMQAFDNIRKLEQGDIIGVCVLNKWFTYEVTYAETVKPDDTESIQVVKSRELLTLVTCTPYGVNSHRLLVHARRVTNYTEFDTKYQPSVRKTLFTLTGIPSLITTCIIVVVLLVSRKRKKEYNNAKKQENIINSDGFGLSLFTNGNGTDRNE